MGHRENSRTLNELLKMIGDAILRIHFGPLHDRQDFVEKCDKLTDDELKKLLQTAHNESSGTDSEIIDLLTQLMPEVYRREDGGHLFVLYKNNRKIEISTRKAHAHH